MPKKGLSPEEKEKQFNQWKESEEYKAIVQFLETKEKYDYVKELENGYADIWNDWQPTLDDLFAVVEKLKVPGRKAKCKF